MTGWMAATAPTNLDGGKGNDWLIGGDGNDILDVGNGTIDLIEPDSMKASETSCSAAAATTPSISPVAAWPPGSTIAAYPEPEDHGQQVRAAP